MTRRACLFPSLLALLLACGVLDFDVSQNIPATTVRGDPVAAAAGMFIAPESAFNPFAFTLNLDQETKSRGTSLASSVKLKAFYLELTAASAEPNFDWVQTFDVFVESTKSGTTLPKVKIASLAASAPRGQRKLVFAVESANLIQYVKEGTKISASARASAPAHDVVFTGAVTFRIGVL